MKDAPKYIMDFMRAAYGDHAELALACFNEQDALVMATHRITELERELAEARRERDAERERCIKCVEDEEPQPIEPVLQVHPVRIAKRSIIARITAAPGGEGGEMSEVIRKLRALNNNLGIAPTGVTVLAVYEIERLERELAEAKAETVELRTLLAVRVSGSALYHDDGELQDNSVRPFIDWKRDTITTIKQKLLQRAAPGGEVKKT